MNVLFWIDNFLQSQTDRDGSFYLMFEGLSRGFRIFCVEKDQIFYFEGAVCVRALELFKEGDKLFVKKEHLICL